MKFYSLAFAAIILATPTPVLIGQDQEKPTVEPILCRGQYHSEEDAIKQLARMAMTYSNLEQWKARATKIRKQILVGANLDPLPKRTPLNSVIHKKRTYEGYTVESAAFEARPGYFVYGNLYRPTGKKAPYPGVLCPHGHSRGPEGGRLRPEQQHRCATLARMALILFGYGVLEFGDAVGSGALHGLKVVAVAVVAQAVWAMARTLCPDPQRATLAALTAIIVLAVPSPFVQVGTIVIGGLVGWAILRADTPTDHVELGVRVPRFISITALVLFFTGLIGLPLLAAAYPSQTMALVDSFYRSGSLVFGGGHVVMPLLQSEVVPPGWVSKDAFLAGYGAAQAVPGPLFTFAAFLGSVMNTVPNGIVGGLICLVAIFASSFLLVIGVLPFWDSLRRVGAVRNALLGINAVVVGLLLAALYDPVWTSAILSAPDFGLALAAFTLLVFWKTPPWLVVILTACGGWALHSGAML